MIKIETKFQKKSDKNKMLNGKNFVKKKKLFSPQSIRSNKSNDQFSSQTETKLYDLFNQSKSIINRFLILIL